MPSSPIAVSYICALIELVVEGFYGQFLRAEDTTAFWPYDTRLDCVPTLQKVYGLQPTQGNYAAVLVHRLYTGQVHQQIGLAWRWYAAGRALEL